MTDIDIDAIREKWLNQCGACDAGLPMRCSHPDGDYRPVIAALLAKVDELTAELERERRAHVCTERCAPNAHVAFQGRRRVTELESKVAELNVALAAAREHDALKADQLTAANRRADGLEADLRSAQRGLTEYAGQVEQLKRAIREALNGVSHVWDAQRIDWVPVAEYAAKKPAEATR